MSKKAPPTKKSRAVRCIKCGHVWMINLRANTKNDLPKRCPKCYVYDSTAFILKAK